MKAIMLFLAIGCSILTNAQTNTCGKNTGMVCKHYGNTSACYQTPYAENYKVCKNDAGYFICCDPTHIYSGYRPVIVPKPAPVQYPAEQPIDAPEAVATTCGRDDRMVCRNGQYCYETKYAQNYKVCKGSNGYYICCETPNATNATFGR